MWGPYNHMVHLISKERLPFTVVYFSTLIGMLLNISYVDEVLILMFIATLYFAMGLQSAILTPIAAVLQVLALLWFVISYIPEIGRAHV